MRLNLIENTGLVSDNVDIDEYKLTNAQFQD
jgi:hypothetical protein